MELLSARETAEKWKLSRRRVQVLCEQGRVNGAVKVGDFWAIPSETTKPEDMRKKENK
ncbi:MAG: DNA-binding protein, partial [Peptostreptococcaceae bacterium]|nr:DNA-binding protein [Peptostreptococcaceae bacterium]